MLGVALLASTPMYADGVLQRLLIRDLERHQDQTGAYPGTAKIEVDLYALRERTQRAPYVEAINKDLNNRIVPALRVPLIEKMRQLRMDHLYDLRPVKNGNKKIFSRVEAIENIERHSTITHGRMFKPNNRNNEKTTEIIGHKVYEAIVTEEAFWEMNLQLNHTYQLNDLVEKSPVLKIKVVGIFEKSDPRDLFWFTRFSQFSGSYIIDFSDFETDFLRTEARNLTRAFWYFAINYHELKIYNIPNIMRRHSEYQRLSNPREIRFRLPIAQLLEKYLERAENLQSTIIFLQIPSILIVFLFVAMLSQMIIDADRSDIKVLKSRGSSKNQLLIAYIFESTILGFLGLILGIPLAILIVRVMGSSNGFLDFVNRPPLDILINWKTLAFSLTGLFFFMGSLIIPLISVTRTSLSRKLLNSSEITPSTTWKRYMIDVLLIGIAGYAYFSFQYRYKNQISISDDPFPLDPLLFIASTIFILGMALFSLRLFPIVINSIFKIGERFWSPITYSGMIQISRSSDRERFAMMFLILTLGVGLVSSITARTINQSFYDNISFEIGADIVIEPEFLNDFSFEDEEIDSLNSSNNFNETTQSVQFQPPPLELFSNLPGLKNLATVYRNSLARMIIPGNIRESMQFMAVNPYEFSRVAWFRDDLLPNHINMYLNLLGNTPSGILLSTYARDNIGIEIGDVVQISWKGQLPLHMYVLGFIDYWPSFGYGASSIFGVSNFQYVFSRMATEPYELWMQLSDGAKRSPLYSAIADREIQILELRDTAQMNILAKNDPLIQGTNGVLTFSFITSTVVTLTGYVLFLVFSLKKRVLQFGLLRALGLHRRQVVIMLIIEQIIIGGYSILSGLIIGQIASVLYVPFLQLAGTIRDNILPFQVVALRSDYFRFYLLSLFIIVVGGLIFRSSVRQIRMHEALKLGDD